MKNLWGAVSAVSLLLLFGGQPASAATYNYIGLGFNEFGDADPPAGDYSESMNVTGSFTIPDPLVGNLVNVTLFGVSDIFFTDGRNTLTTATATRVSTDAAGNIVEWNFDLRSGTLDSVGDLAYRIVTSTGLNGTAVRDQGLMLYCAELDCTALLADFGIVNNNPGAWSPRVAPVPGPIVGAGLPGLVMAFGGLIAFVRRRRRLQTA